MDDQQFARLGDICEKLLKLNKEINSPTANYRIETRDKGEDLLEIYANREGHMYIAYCALKVALGQFDGKQWQIDQHNMLDYCERKLVLTLMLDQDRAIIEESDNRGQE